MMKKSVILVEKNPENETKEDEYQESLPNSKGRTNRVICLYVPRYIENHFFVSEFEGLCSWLKFIILFYNSL